MYIYMSVYFLCYIFFIIYKYSDNICVYLVAIKISKWARVEVQGLSHLSCMRLAQKCSGNHAQSMFNIIFGIYIKL